MKLGEIESRAAFLKKYEALCQKHGLHLVNGEGSQMVLQEVPDGKLVEVDYDPEGALVSHDFVRDTRNDGMP